MRKFDDIQLYKDSLMCLKILTRYLLDMPKPIRFTYGDELIKHALYILQNAKIIFDEQDKSEKTKLIGDTKKSLSRLEVTVNAIFENGFMTDKHYMFVNKYIGSIQTQLTAWSSSINLNKN